MPKINPYIHFNGNAEEAFNFYKSVFGGEFLRIARYKDFTNLDNQVAEKEGNKLAHIALPIGPDNILMGSDVPEFMGPLNEAENRSKIYVTPDSKAEADRLYQGLSVGGQIEMPIGDSPWGTYFGMFRDIYGIEWMIDFDPRNTGSRSSL
jgi:PhnB protein